LAINSVEEEQMSCAYAIETLAAEDIAAENTRPLSSIPVLHIIMRQKIIQNPQAYALKGQNFGRISRFSLISDELATVSKQLYRYPPTCSPPDSRVRKEKEP